jgi:hypothetical protein
LKAGAWVRRIRLAIVAPDLRHSRRSQAELPLIDLSEFGRPPLWIPFDPAVCDGDFNRLAPQIFSGPCFMIIHCGYPLDNL